MPPPLLWIPGYFWSEIYQANISCLLNDIISSLGQRTSPYFPVYRHAIQDKYKCSVRTDEINQT